MGDTLRQEKAQRRRGFWLSFSAVLIGLNVLIYLFVPTQKHISCDTDAIIYSVADESYEKPCHVSIDGYLTKSILLKNSFEGSFYITDIPGLEEGMTLHLTREDGAWKGYFCTQAGQTIQTGVWDVEATKDFEKITVAFASVYQKDEASIESSFSKDSATFLALDTPNRIYALRQYQELIASHYPDE